MALFDAIVKKLFPGDKEVSIHEVLKRSPQFIEAFENWKKSDKALEIFNDILNSYHDKLTNRHPTIDIELYHSPYSNGILIYTTRKDYDLPFEYIMEFIRDNLEKEGYRLVNSDRKIRETGDKVEKLEKYYLKPPISPEAPIDQLFGNIIVELFYKNETPDRLRIMANVYSDRLYNEPKKFSELISLLFDQRTLE